MVEARLFRFRNRVQSRLCSMNRRLIVQAGASPIATFLVWLWQGEQRLLGPDCVVPLRKAARGFAPSAGIGQVLRQQFSRGCVQPGLPSGAGHRGMQRIRQHATAVELAAIAPEWMGTIISGAIVTQSGPSRQYSWSDSKCERLCSDKLTASSRALFVLSSNEQGRFPIPARVSAFAPGTGQ